MRDERRCFKLTKISVDGRCLPDKDRPQVIYWDTDERGFGIVVGKKTKTYIVQRDMRGGRTVRVTIGRHGTWTAEEARKEAKSVVVRMNKDENPNVERRKLAARGVTLEQGMEMHIARLRKDGGSPRSESDIRVELKRYVSDWLPRPLAELTKSDCRVRHERVTANHGPYVANRVLRAVRAIYNTARVEHDLPEPNPCIAVHWNKQRRRQEPVPWAALPDWHAKVLGLSPVRRDYYLFLLLTGLRRTDAATIRWEHVDFDKGTLHRPRPKGGEDRAFTIPLSPRALKILSERKRENAKLFDPWRGDAGWAFPTTIIAKSERHAGKRTIVEKTRVVTHLREAKEQRFAKGEDGKMHKVKHLPSPHRLRDTYTTACHECGLQPYDIDVLTNHRPPTGTVTAGYIRQSPDHLRKCQEKVANYIWRHVTAPASKKSLARAA